MEGKFSKTVALLIISSGMISAPGRNVPVRNSLIELGDEEKSSIVEIHNLYRGNASPPSANMKHVQWDAELEETARAWASLCTLKHGKPAVPRYHSSFGQSLYIGSSKYSHRAMWLWYNEVKDYNHQVARCARGRECGHYIQMMWWETNLIGCALAQCGKTTFYFVCHYNPQFINNSAPYTVGKPCSLCDAGDGGLCSNNLCVKENLCAEDSHLKCECRLECHNCGRLNKSSCSCECMDGWDMLDCSRHCEDESEHCGKKDGYPSVLNCPMYKNRVKDRECRKMCLACNITDENNLSRTCCDGMSCSPGYIIDLQHRPCSCMLLCPGPECYPSRGRTWLLGSTSLLIGALVTLWEI